jgi:branched-chain amino acid transport system permease protein
MLAAQIIINALVLGCLYACIAIGFSLVWGVLNVINLIHGSIIVLGAYLAWGAYQSLAISPWYVLPVACRCFSRSAICCSGCCSIASSRRRSWSR